MTPLLTLVAAMAIITWLLLLIASMVGPKAWTLSGLQFAFGNRSDPTTPSAFAGRAERTARNTLENFVLFAAIALVAHASGVTDPRVLMGAQLFFYARLVYIPLYYIGIPYLRTASWTISIIGLGIMLSALFI